MDESFGTRMRQRRESLQISLSTIAERTKIKLSLLEALERDDVTRWPSGIFRRAFIRAYAQAIELDPDVVVREFLDRYPDPLEDVAAAAALARASEVSVNGEGAPTRFRQLLDAAIEVLGHRRVPVRPRLPTVEDPTVDDSPPVKRITLPQPAPVAPQMADTISPGKTSTPPRLTPVEPPIADDTAPAMTIAQSGPDLLAAADVCTELGQVHDFRETASVLQRAVKILDAVGLIVWVWDPEAAELAPALAHGYSDAVLAHLPKVRADDDNATAAAFRSGQTSIVNGSQLASGACVVPLLTPCGCVGVLAIELRGDTVQNESVRALAMIFGAQLARVLETTLPAVAADWPDGRGAVWPPS